MNKHDYYYRAFTSYKNEANKSKELGKEVNEFVNSNTNLDKLTSVKYLCNIEEDWIKAIEEGLVHVEKALAEERQFIRSNGEVVPIEKVKKVSRDSVEHLAKHSNMITHVPKDGKDVVPDAIYMVEKLSDYAVYENRFLYMLLSYLKQFIVFRLDKIEKLRRSYVGDLYLNKNVETPQSLITYEVTIHEERKNNPFPIADKKCEDMIQRIKDCDQIINAMLNTDLMVQVSKSPMIKPPITKTNVLKMNNNFKNSLALYDYIAGYKGDGYSYKEVVSELAPFDEALATSLAHSARLTTFIEYEYGNNIHGVLKTSYKEEEQRRKQEEEANLVAQIERLKRHVAESGKSIEEYMFLLEKRNKQLEGASEDLAIAHNEIVSLNKKIDSLYQEIDLLNKKIEDLEAEIQRKIQEIIDLINKHIEEIRLLKEEHARQIEELNLAHAEEIERLNKEHEEKLSATIEELKATYREELKNTYETQIAFLNKDIERLNEDHNLSITSMQESHSSEVNSLNEKYNDEINSLNEKYTEEVSNLNKDLSNLTNEKNTLVANYEDTLANTNEKLNYVIKDRNTLVDAYEEKLRKIEKDYQDLISTLKYESDASTKDYEAKVDYLKTSERLGRSELVALKAKMNIIEVGPDYATRERFNELEDEFLAFSNFFKKQWKFTKKEIRKRLLWVNRREKNAHNMNDPVLDLPTAEQYKALLEKKIKTREDEKKIAAYKENQYLASINEQKEEIDGINEIAAKKIDLDDLDELILQNKSIEDDSNNIEENSSEEAILDNIDDNNVEETSSSDSDNATGDENPIDESATTIDEENLKEENQEDNK